MFLVYAINLGSSKNKNSFIYIKTSKNSLITTNTQTHMSTNVTDTISQTKSKEGFTTIAILISIISICYTKFPQVSIPEFICSIFVEFHYQLVSFQSLNFNVIWAEAFSDDFYFIVYVERDFDDVFMVDDDLKT